MRSTSERASSTRDRVLPWMRRMTAAAPGAKVAVPSRSPTIRASAFGPSSRS